MLDMTSLELGVFTAQKGLTHKFKVSASFLNNVQCLVLLKSLEKEASLQEKTSPDRTALALSNLTSPK